MFVEHGHNKQLLKNLVVEYNNKKNNKNNYENNTQNRDYANLNKLPWIPNISPKMTREFKKIGKDIAFTSGGIYSKFSVKRIHQSYYQIVRQEYTSWIARAMGNILANRKRGYLHDV